MLATVTAQIINWMILGFIITGIVFLVVWDARKRGYSRATVVMWVMVSLVLFPIGLLVFLLIGRK